MDATEGDEDERRKRDFGRGAGSERASLRFRQQSAAYATLSRLVSTIEGEVIPRLLLALQSTPAMMQGTVKGKLSADDVAEFANLVATREAGDATDYVNALLNRGASLENIYLELLAPAARLLGEWWTADLRDFTEVTSALCRMRQLLHQFSPMFLHGVAAAAPDKGVLLIPMPGEQHSFGLMMVAEFFRSASWDVWDLHPATTEDVLGVVRRHWFAIVGVSVACNSRIDAVTSLIAAIRTESRNRVVRVMVGGHPFVSNPELAVKVGADATSVDGRWAPIEAGRLMNQGASIHAC